MATLFRLFSGWPLGLLHLLGAVLGWVAFLASARYRQRFLANARIAGYGSTGSDAFASDDGRTAFDPNKGRRRLQGCYVDKDGMESRMRVLRRKLNGAAA